MKRFWKSFGLLAAVGLVTVMAGCATAHTGGTGDSYGTVLIENDSPLTVNIFAIRQSSRFRLGTVTGLGQEEFPLKRHMLGVGAHLQLLIEPLGGQQSYYTDRIYLEQGESVRLRVSNFIR